MKNLVAARKKIIRAGEAYAKKVTAGDRGGHDWHHVERVRTMAVRIARAEKIDPFLPELMALLHDLHDRKVVGPRREQLALRQTKRWLQKQKLPAAEVAEIMYVITNQSYSASGIRGEKLTSRAGLIMQDADRLDALGAIGIARCFAYAVGKRGNPMHDPSLPRRTKELSVAEYRKDKDTAINHFYEKLLKLKDLMNTTTGRRIARQRHAYMKKFLTEFLAEWNGKR